MTGSVVQTRVGPALVWCGARDLGNVGDHVGDDPVAVARHREAFAAAAGLPASTRWAWMRQVHGAAVYVADGPTPPDEPPVADALVTSVRGLPLAVVTADCAPVVLANDGAVAVVHAGHRGLASGVVEAALREVRERGDGTVHAYLGPCIRASAYEFGPADLAGLVEQFGPTVAATTRAGTPALDIPAALRVVFAREGVDAFDDCGRCTADDDGYFSYRRDGTTGRQATVAVLP